MLSPTSSFAALSIDEPVLPASSAPPKPAFRRTVLLSLAFLLFVIIAVVVTLSVVLPHRNASNGTAQLGSTITVSRRPGGEGLWVLDPSTSNSSVMPSTSEQLAAASRAHPSDAHTFHWLFPQRDLDWLSSEFGAVTDPSSPRFQQWHSHASLMARIGPTAEDKAAVTSWLLSQGVSASAIADHGDAFQVDTTVGAVEAMFGTTMHYMRHASLEQSATVALSGEASVPAALAGALESLHGVYDFPHALYHLTTVFTPHPTPAPSHPTRPTPIAPRMRPSPSHNASRHAFHAMQTEETNAQCSSVSSFYPLASPAFLSSAYDFASRQTATGSSGTSAMVTAFGGQAFSTNDLAHFQTNVGYSQTFSPTVINPSTNTANLNANGPGDEANLDIQALYQISPTSSNSFYASKSSASLLSAMQAITAMSASTRPQVVSISYGFGASDYNYHASDAGRTDTQFQTMGTMGITVVVSAGDDGTAGPYNRGCSLTPNSLGYGTITPLSSSPMLPGYPAASPYVLSVGETDFLRSATSANQAYGAFTPSVNTPVECNNCPTDQNGVAFLCQASNLGEQPVSYGARSAAAAQTSGGGFSTVYSTPSWQSSAVSGYLSTQCTAANGCTLPPSSYYVSSNRGYPDVAAFGGYFGIVNDGEETVLSGTSVAAPLWAGFIARLNEASLAASGATVGFVNPLFYSMAAADPSTFNDITTGENACPQTNSACATHYQGGGGSTTCSGFYAAPGWDPVSGLGSPNIGAILSYISAQ